MPAQRCAGTGGGHGRSRRSGAALPAADDVTPRLPSGFTLLTARGQWRGSDGTSRGEDSRLLEVVADDSAAHRQTLAELVGRYKQRFAQESVLVTQSSARVCW